MSDQELLARITLNPKVMVGKPAIQGTRLTVEHVLERLAHGASEADLLSEYAGLTSADLQACFLYASKQLAVTPTQTLMPIQPRQTTTLRGIWKDKFPADLDLDAALKSIRSEWEGEIEDTVHGRTPR